MINNISYDSTIVEKISQNLIKPERNTTNILLSSFKRYAQEDGFDYSDYQAQGLASRMGSICENAWLENLINDYKDYSEITVFKGIEIAKEIKLFRKNNSDINEICTFLSQKYLINKNYAHEMLMSKKSLHFPDLLVINYKENSIKCAEMKASGQNDSASVPENIDKMRFNTRNSAIQAWYNTNVKLNKAIILSAAIKNNKNKYIHANNWINIINKNNLNNEIQVYCNEEAYNWFSCTTITEKDYYYKIINPTAIVELIRLKQS